MNDPRNHNPFNAPEIIDFDDIKSEHDAHQALKQASLETCILISLCEALDEIARSYDHAQLRKIK